MSASPVGFILIDKAADLTSHFVVSRVGRIIRAQRIGHLGTLDPFATGLLPLLVGGATRLADEVMDGKKGYEFTIKFGQETDTLDSCGRVVAEKPVPPDFAVRLANALSQFQGQIEQVPPVYSALKMNGRPLYEHMRATGKLPVDIESKRRLVSIHSLELMEADQTDEGCFARLRVFCGKGTYVRSLARDLAIAVETVGFCCQLRRIYVEPWSVGDALSFSREAMPTEEEILTKLQPVEKLVPNLPKLEVAEQYHKPLSSGNIFEISEEHSDLQLAKESIVSPIKALVSCQALLFLAEISAGYDSGSLKIHPRKKIC